MPDIRFTREHEWVSVEGQTAMIGITDHAQQQLGDIVFVDLPSVGKAVNKGDEALALESTKAAASVYAPIGGTVAAVNETLADAPETVNADPMGDGWMIKIDMADAGELESLMNEAAYQDYLSTLE